MENQLNNTSEPLKLLTAREAAGQILAGKVDKKRIWDINVGDEYHEEVGKG